MDIDFHFWATYSAARFADLDHSRAWTIASSAQMVDENALGAVGGDSRRSSYFTSISIKETKEAPRLIDYQIIQSFQTIKDIVRSKNIAYKAYWPVFHFLPGNFEPNHYPGDLEETCREFWVRRIARPQTELKGKESINYHDYFPWLTRPYSPMAITLIRNCRDLVNKPSSDICRYGLSDYLIGITMHVFIDTWAHQDFVGYTSKSINGMRQGPFQQAKKTKFDGTQDKALGLLSFAGEEGATWLGHGPAGHWPDHSGLTFEYVPMWSGDRIVRDNPKEYMEAFVNMIEAIKCIVNDKPYHPITVDNAKLKGHGKGHLGLIEDLIRYQRSSDGSGTFSHQGARKIKTLSDSWDDNMYLFNSEWINTVQQIFGGKLTDYPDWIPGESSWIRKAKDACKKNWLTPEEFIGLDYFKFNVAAKFHFTFVQQQLLSFGQRLLEDWPVGFTYANDLAALGAAPRDDGKKVEIITALRELQRKAAKSSNIDLISSLLNQVQDAPHGKAAQEVLINAILDTDEQNNNLNNGRFRSDFIQLDELTLAHLKKISGIEQVSIKLAADKYIDGSVSGFTDIILSQPTINSLAESLIKATNEYINKSKSDLKSTGARRAASFRDALIAQREYGGDGNYKEEYLGELFYNVFVNNKVGHESFGGIFGIGGGIQTTENSLFTFAANGLINDPLFGEAMGWKSSLRNLSPNKKLTMTSGYAAKGECMCIRRLLFRSLDLDPKKSTAGKYLITAKDSAILLNAVKSR